MSFSEIPDKFGSGIIEFRLVTDFDVAHATWDFSKVVPNTLYFCLENEEFAETHMKGNSLDHWKEAREKGAGAFVCAPEVRSAFSPEINLVVVENPNRFMGEFFRHYFGDPFSNVKVVGVTGTNGKTTTSQLIDGLLVGEGLRSGISGTIGIRYADVNVEPGHLSNPTADSLFLHGAAMAKEGINHLVMEVTSHAMEFCRNDSIDFDLGVFTNITQDHLDFHGTMENYTEAKKKFFRNLGSGEKKATAVINFDDSKGYDMYEAIPKERLESGKVRLISYGIRNKETHLTAYPLQFNEIGSKYRLFHLGKYQGEVEINFPGIFNLYNSLAALATGFSLGIPFESMIRHLRDLQPIFGRFEKIPDTENIHVYVDYAHTPDALENILKSLKEISEGRLLCLFGCGGDRDASKRPRMGKIATELADYTWVTSDNPRTEDPMGIINDILEGVNPDKPVRVDPDRRKAIQAVLAFAGKNDSVLIAGKGHEKYQLVGKQKIHFSDRAEVINFFRNKPERASLNLFPSRLKRNFELIFADKPQNLNVFAVVKDNGLGFGLVETAKIAASEGCAYICVACLSEAMELRNGGVAHPILVLGERFDSELVQCAKAGLTLQVQSLEKCALFGKICGDLHLSGKVHLKVDTGMGRYGVKAEQADRLYHQICSIPHLEVEGIFTHFARSDEADKEYARFQFDRFEAVLRRIEDDLPKYRHACNSGGYLDLPEFHLNAVRLGALPTGVYPSEVCRRIQIDGEGLKPVYSLTTRVAFCKPLEIGEKVGYGMHFEAKRKTRIAVLPIGYGDGYPRMRNRGEVLIRGLRYPIIGGIGLDAMMVDLGDGESVFPGDPVTLVGEEGGESISFRDLAKQAGTVTYDVMTRWNGRLPRIVRD